MLQEDGSYAGFDPSEFPSRSGGKREAVQHIKQVRAMQAVQRFLYYKMLIDSHACFKACATLSCCCICRHPPLQAHGYQTVIMVGDGMTDAEARAPCGADAFIGWVGRVFGQAGAALRSGAAECTVTACSLTLRSA